jgi:hypothetical protein
VNLEPRTERQSLLDTFQVPVIGGRWLLVAAATIESVLFLVTGPPPGTGLLTLGLLFVYNVISLVVVHRVPVRRVPVPGLLALDLGFVAAVAYQTGGTASPFLGQCFLIIFAAALFYGFWGGLAIGAVSVVIAVSVSGTTAGDAGRELRTFIPYFLIGGGFAGYLTERIRTWFRRYRESSRQARARELEAQIAEREMVLARQMQRAALPPNPPAMPGLDMAVRSRQARHVSGDFYLFIPDQHRIAVVIGDVSGKGFPAALISTTIGHLLPWFRPLRDPKAALLNLNRDLQERLPVDAFVSLILADLDVEAECLRLWTAGHPPALLWRAAEGRVVEAAVHNPILGIFPTWEACPEDLPLRAGDMLALYTDGLIEVRNEAGEMFETRRADEVLAANAHRSAAEVAQALVDAAAEWGELTDDLTVLVCKRVPG